MFFLNRSKFEWFLGQTGQRILWESFRNGNENGLEFVPEFTSLHIKQEPSATGFTVVYTHVASWDCSNLLAPICQFKSIHLQGAIIAGQFASLSFISLSKLFSWKLKFKLLGLTQSNTIMNSFQVTSIGLNYKLKTFTMNSATCNGLVIEIKLMYSRKRNEMICISQHLKLMIHQWPDGYRINWATIQSSPVDCFVEGFHPAGNHKIDPRWIVN